VTGNQQVEIDLTGKQLDGQEKQQALDKMIAGLRFDAHLPGAT
jgi:hypothetical protein